MDHCRPRPARVAREPLENTPQRDGGVRESTEPMAAQTSRL